MPKDLHHVYDSMVDEMCALASENRLLDSCMSLNPDAIRLVPLRYRLIALGFVRHYSLAQLNDKLNEQNLPKLYARSFWEATLIFAFLHGYDYEQWKSLQQQCADLYETVSDPSWFTEKKITYADLRRYVEENSSMDDTFLHTRMQTRMLEAEIRQIGDDVECLRHFLQENIRAFSLVREKTRYYFCKYLLYSLDWRINRYLAACRENRGTEEALTDLLCLKAVTPLRRNPHMPEEDKLAVLHNSSISCGELFDMFNYFYFGYVSVNWQEALLECYETPEEIPPVHRKRLAEVFRKKDSSLKSLSDVDAIRAGLLAEEQAADRAYSLDGTRGYNRSRDGETALYRYIRGIRDIDRPVLLCFLLFFSHDAQMPDAHRLTVDRLQAILRECGLPPLDIENDFDWFVVEFLESRRPMDFLMDVITGYARQHENSFLYHVYENSVQYEGELSRIMLQKD